MRSKILSICSILGVFGVLAMPAYATEIGRYDEAVDFAPHKALYDIKMSGARSGSQIINISGQMFYEWQPTCDAWISNHRFNILYEYADSAPMRITSNFSTHEAFDGSTLNFTSQRKRDGELFEEIRGTANASMDEQGNAVFTIPAELEFDLPKSTLFPIAHSMAVTEKIRAGETFYSTPIFDGSDEDGPVTVNTFIGKPVTPEQAKSDDTALDQDLLASPARNIRLAFFPLFDEEEATSDYEMNLVYHENSLISDMVIEYDDFTVSQKLVAVEPMEDGCQPPRLND